MVQEGPAVFFSKLNDKNVPYKLCAVRAGFSCFPAAMIMTICGQEGAEIANRIIFLLQRASVDAGWHSALRSLRLMISL